MKLNLFKTDVRSLAAGLVLAAFGIGVAPTASAFSTYEAYAEFELILVDVTDSSGATVTSGWEVLAEGDGILGFDSFGTANADGIITVVDPSVSLSIGDGIFQSSEVFGDQTSGWAYTDALTDLAISVSNFSGMDLTFSFDYSAMADAMTSVSNPLETAEANAYVDMLDDLGAVDLQIWATAVDGNPATGSGNAAGGFHFTLADGGFNDITGFVDSDGFTEVVPVPAAVWLFGSGLLGLVAVARRKQAV